MKTNTDISTAFELIGDHLGQVKEAINNQLNDGSQSVGRLLQDFNICGGKMIRPALVLLSGLCCGKITDEHIRTAAVIEIVHNATLLHDDVIDEGQKRRGAETVNSLWGNESAVLLGDFLFSKACQLCSELDQQINKTITQTTATICQGELNQIANRRNWDLSESKYIDIITEKSASLFRTCCYLGAVLAGANESKAEAMAQFGCNLGIAFQIADDMLDIVADETSTGKTCGRDIDKNKLTLPIIHLLKTLDQKQQAEVINKLDDGDVDYLTRTLKQTDSLEYTSNRAEEFIAKAIEALEILEDSQAKSALIEVSQAIVGRVT